MNKFLLAKKIGMSQIFDPSGRVIPVTLVETRPLTVIRQKTEDRDGYVAVQFGSGRRRDTHIAKAQRQSWQGLGVFEVLREGRGMSGQHPGQTLDLTQFQEGDSVAVSGLSKSKGFQGVVKRHGFHGAPRTHGTKHAHREPGSIGATWPQRVIKGRRMAGRMGGERVTLRNVKVVKIDPERQLLALKGAVPGRRGTLLEIRG